MLKSEEFSNAVSGKCLSQVLTKTFIVGSKSLDVHFFSAPRFADLRGLTNPKWLEWHWRPHRLGKLNLLTDGIAPGAGGTVVYPVKSWLRSSGFVSFNGGHFFISQECHSTFAVSGKKNLVKKALALLLGHYQAYATQNGDILLQCFYSTLVKFLYWEMLFTWIHFKEVCSQKYQIAEMVQ